MGIIAKFPSQSKQSTMTPPAPITGNPEKFPETISLMAEIPEKYRETFHIKRLGDNLAPILIYASKYGGAVAITPNKKTMIRFNYAEANEDDLPLVKSIEIYEMGKYTITMSIDFASGYANVTTYIWS
jgi:hypothetical protein